MDPQKIAKQSEKKWEQFYQKYWRKDDTLTIVLKSHLFIENLLDEIFSLSIPNPSHIIEMKFYDKIRIFEALNFSSSEIVAKLLAINSIRNKYSHNLKFEIKTKDIQQLIKNLDTKGMNNQTKLKYGIVYTISYLHAIIAIIKIIPFSNTCVRNNKIFKKEKGYSFKKVNKTIYPKDDFSDIDIIKSLRM